MFKQLVIVAAACLLLPAATLAEDSWHYDPAQDRIGRIYYYERSNTDGSLKERVTVYRKDASQLEVYKENGLCGRAALVQAELDLASLSAHRLIAGQLKPDAQVMEFGTLTANDDGSAVDMLIKLPGMVIQDDMSIGNQHWQLFDFDLASLTVATPHLDNRRQGFDFGMGLLWADSDTTDPLFWLGEVEARFSGEVVHLGVDTEKYLLSGTAFGGKRATGATAEMWLDAKDGHIVDARFPIPNHPGYTDFRLRLIKVSDGGSTEWTKLLTAHFEDCGEPAAAPPVHQSSAAASYSAEAIREDLDELMTFVRSTHPDLTYSADPDEVASMETLIKKSVATPLSQQEVWALFAQLNPVFADAHVGVRRPIEAIAQFQQLGGILLPVPVVLEGDATPRLGHLTSGPLTAYSGAKILSINQHAMTEHVATLLPRMRGETEDLRLKVMARYFAEYYWILHGGTSEYVLVLEKDGKSHRIIVDEKCCEDEAADSIEFAYRTLMPGKGYLRVDSFDITKKEAFADFLPGAFSSMVDDGVETLIIDLRQNTGGAADTSNLLMAYLTDKAYSSISAVTARVAAENVARIPNSKIGDVVELPFRLNVTPPRDLKNRFSGKVIILIGPLSYSQAIVFAATAKDHGIAVLAGTPTEGAANQTGQVQFHRLKNTGIEVMAPLYIFTRASGEKGRAPLRPDILLEEQLLSPEAAVEELLTQLP